MEIKVLYIEKMMECLNDVKCKSSTPYRVTKDYASNY